MRDNDFSNPIFHDEAKARAWLEARLWPEGPICAHCGAINEATLMKGKTHRAGLYKCKACREDFSVTVGTLCERSHVPLHKWLAVTHLMLASKKGMSALQISRLIGVTYKTSWFLCHRIRESLREHNPSPIGGEGVTIEADETYVGGKERNKHKAKRNAANIGPVGKEMVFSLVERGGQVRSRHMTDISAKNLKGVLHEQITDAAKTRLMTDGEGQYRLVAPMFLSHGVVNHGIGEYVRGDVTTNSVESYFALLKRGVIGTFHHVSPQHLKRYVGEFDYRYNTRTALGFTDAERFHMSIPGLVGKRLSYRRTNGGAETAAS